MTELDHTNDLSAAIERARAGGPERHRARAAEQGRLPVRERVALLVDPDSFVEDGLLASWEEDGLGADGVVTGIGTVAGRRVAVMANDPTVKAGSWSAKTMEKILRIQERALSLRIALVYLVDSAGARINEQVQMFPGRRHAGRIFFNQVRLSGIVPQVCVLFVDSSDKCARFIQTCNAFNIPLLFLADVPGFMIGTQVEKEGIIRHGAKMISAVSEANVPKISVIVRKAYGAGLYAMAGPAFDPDACLALPTASIAVMGPDAAINAVYYNQLQAIDDPDAREARRAELRAAYAEDIDILHLASELIVDAVIQPEDLRDELLKRFRLAAGKHRGWPEKHNPITPA